jgi:hypothetical protein
MYPSGISTAASPHVGQEIGGSTTLNEKPVKEFAVTLGDKQGELKTPRRLLSLSSVGGCVWRRRR